MLDFWEGMVGVFVENNRGKMGVNPWESSPEKKGKKGIQETKSSAWATLKVSCISTPLMTFVRGSCF